MTVFADSSALVAWLAAEPGRSNHPVDEVVVVSDLARVEVPAAIWRKERMGELDATYARALIDDFEADYFGDAADLSPRLAAVATSALVLDEAARLCGVHGLRAYDAVQLAAALAARIAEPSCDTFAAHDIELRRAAATEGWQLIPE